VVDIEKKSQSNKQKYSKNKIRARGGDTSQDNRETLLNQKDAVP
jgi:hypothetical protein